LDSRPKISSVGLLIILQDKTRQQRMGGRGGPPLAAIRRGGGKMGVIEIGIFKFFVYVSAYKSGQSGSG